MDIRAALILALLALVGTNAHAEELQWTIIGNVQCFPFSNCSSQAVVGAGTITFDFNTADATLTPTFGPGPSGGPDVLTNLSVVFPLSDYSAIVNGQTIASSATGFGSFGCFGFPVSPKLYECDGGFAANNSGIGSYQFVDNETWLHTITEAQYNSLQDPLAYLLSDPTNGTGCGNGGATCYMLEDGGNLNFASNFHITAVPTPKPLPLAFLGFVGLALSRYFRRPTVAPSP